MLNFKSVLYKEKYYSISYKLKFILSSNLNISSTCKAQLLIENDNYSPRAIMINSKFLFDNCKGGYVYCKCNNTSFDIINSLRCKVCNKNNEIKLYKAFYSSPRITNMLKDENIKLTILKIELPKNYIKNKPGPSRTLYWE